MALQSDYNFQSRDVQILIDFQALQSDDSVQSRDIDI